MNNEELEVKINALKELTCHAIASQERLVAEKFAGIDKALSLQAKEYERRLDFLNGEADRLREMQTTYLPRELYESHHDPLCQRVKELELNKATQEGKASQKSVFIAIGISAIGIIIGILSLVLH